MIQTDINIELTVQVNGTRYVVEKELEVFDEIGNEMSKQRLKAADEILEACTNEIRRAMGVPTREY